MNDFTGRQLIHKILMQAWDLYESTWTREL